MQGLLSVSLMVTIKHKPVIDTQKIMRKECRHNTTESYQTTREESKKPEKTEMNYKTEKKNDNQCIPMNNFKCKWTNFSNQKTYTDQTDKRKQDPLICCLIQ